MSEEQPGQAKPHSDYILARAIATSVIVGAGYGISRLANFELTSSFAFFMLVVVGGSFLGSIIGRSIGQKMAAK